MSSLKYLLLSLFALVSTHSMCQATTHCGGVDFRTGEEYWGQSKLHYHVGVAGQFQNRHDYYVKLGDDCFKSMIEMDQEKKLYCPIAFTVSCDKDMDLNFVLSPGGSAQLQLFLAFNEALVEIFHTGGEIFNAAKYVRSDLNKVKDYFAEALTFLKGVRHISGYIFKGEKSDFNEVQFLKSLNNTSYAEAHDLNQWQHSWKEDIKATYGGKITLNQFIDFYTSLYSKMFVNQYIFLKAHLTSQDKMTRLKLNRKLEGGLKDFAYNLTTVNLLDSLNFNISEKKEEAPTNQTQKKSQRKRSKKKRQDSSKKEELPTPTLTESSSYSEIQNQTSTSQAITTEEPATFLQDTHTSTSLIPNNSVLPLITDLVTEEKEISNIPSILTQLPSSVRDEKEFVPTEKGEYFSSNSNDNIIVNFERFKAAFVQEEDPQHGLANHNYNLAFGNTTEPSIFPLPSVSSLPKEDFLKEKKQHPGGPTKQISDVEKLNNILDEFDGGPSAGMKTRKFLRLCAALNEGGFFSEFSATKKEVFIKTDDMVTVMHTNHSGKMKSPGITNNTANKLQEVIERIQK